MTIQLRITDAQHLNFNGGGIYTSLIGTEKDDLTPTPWTLPKCLSTLSLRVDRYLHKEQENAGSTPQSNFKWYAKFLFELNVRQHFSHLKGRSGKAFGAIIITVT